MLSKKSTLLGKFVRHKGYKKFIVLTRSRTGSNLLISMLESHHAIRAKGEIFQNLNGQPEDSILNDVFRKYPLNIKAVGFKIFYYHPLNNPSELIWEKLKNIEDLNIIHLKRRNILKTLLSRKIAGKTDQWKEKKNSGDKAVSEDKKVTFSDEELLEGFKETRMWEKSRLNVFNGKNLIDIYYEDLISNPEREFKKIMKLLNLDYEAPEIQLKKQNPENLPDLIENYTALKQRFANTEWSDFFED